MKDLNEIRRENLSRLIHEAGGVEALAVRIGRSAAQVSQWRNNSPDSRTGRPRNMHFDSARGIEKRLGLEPNWLDTDHTGRPYRPAAAEIPAGAAVREIAPDDYLDPGVYVSVPHYDVQASAGDGQSAVWVQHDQNDPLVFRSRWFRARGLKPDNCKALYVKGNSMTPGLEDGDTVLIDVSKTEVRDDEIYAVVYHGDLFIKRLFRVPGGGVELRSDNDRTYKPVLVLGEDLEHLIILGQKVYRSG